MLVNPVGMEIQNVKKKKKKKLESVKDDGMKTDTGKTDCIFKI